MLNELRHLKTLLRERGFLYLLGGIERRWKPSEDIIYVLEMRLEKRVVTSSSVVKMTTPDVILSFAHERELEDGEWERGKYVQEVIQRFKNGDWCFVAKKDMRIVSVIFVSRGPCYIAPVGYTLQIPDRTVGLYDIYTLLAYRGLHLYSAVFRKAVNSSLKEGYNAAWMWIMPHNVVSLKANEKLGLRHIFKGISLCQRWGFRWHKVRSLDIDVKELLLILK